jgi:hypothetical protein
MFFSSNIYSFSAFEKDKKAQMSGAGQPRIKAGQPCICQKKNTPGLAGEFAVPIP